MISHQGGGYRGGPQDARRRKKKLPGRGRLNFFPYGRGRHKIIGLWTRTPKISDQTPCDKLMMGKTPKKR